MLLLNFTIRTTQHTKTCIITCLQDPTQKNKVLHLLANNPVFVSGSGNANQSCGLKIDIFIRKHANLELQSSQLAYGLAYGHLLYNGSLEGMLPIGTD